MARVMLNELKKEVAGKVLIFSDEDFHLNKHLNRRNNHTIAANGKTVDPANRFQGQPKFPQKAMFFGFVGSEGKAFPGVWIKGTMNGCMYKSILIHNVFLVLDATYSQGNYIWDAGWSLLPHQQSHDDLPEEQVGVQGVLVKGNLTSQLLQHEPLGLQSMEPH